MSNALPINVRRISDIRAKYLVSPIIVKAEPGCSEFVQKENDDGYLFNRTSRTVTEVNRTIKIEEDVPDVYLMRIQQELWHGLGTIFNSQPTLPQIHDFLSTEIEVKTENVRSESGILIPETKAVVWNNKCLGTIGNKTIPFPNYRFVQKLKVWQDLGYPLRSIGYLDGGKIIFATVEVPCEGLEIFKGDAPIQLYINIQHGHCNNMSHLTSFSQAFPGNQSILGFADPEVRKMEQSLAARHSPKQGETHEDFEEIMTEYIAKAKENAKMIRSLGKKPADKKEIFEFYSRVYDSAASTKDDLNRRSKSSYLQLENAFETEGGKTMLDLFLAASRLWTATLNDLGDNKYDQAGRQLRKLLSPTFNFEADKRLKAALG